MIEKILDNYYSKKLDDFIKLVEMEYYLDFKHIYTKDSVLIQVKKKKYKDTLFVEIAHFKKENAFLHLCNRDKLEEHFEKLIKNYCESQV